MFDYAVIGCGLIGAAAGRYLSAIGKRVALIGPLEPENWQTHQGVFASHYDQGRITRVLDEDIVWAKLAQRSIAQYRFIEQESGISFYQPVGGLQVGATASDFVDNLTMIGRETQVDFQTYIGAELTQATKHYRFPAETSGLLEAGGAGYIHPRSLVAAQLKVATKQGAHLVRETAIGLDLHGDSITIKTDEGHTFQSRKVLLAAGAFTNQLLAQPLAINPRGISIFLGEINKDDMVNFDGMSTLIYRLPSYNQIASIYMIPPTQYPDGKYYFKIGGTRQPYQYLHSFEERRAWFQSHGDEAGGEELRQILTDVVPGLNLISGHTKPCVTTYTESGRPFIDVLEPDRLFVVAGGNGAAAKSSNEIGRVAATLVEKGRWTYDLPANLFNVQYRA